MKMIGAFISGACVLGGVCFGQEKEVDPFDDEDWHRAELLKKTPETWEVMMEVFSVPFAEAAKLRREMGDTAKIYGELVKRVEGKKAVLEEFVILKGTVGVESETESIEEYIYATEYEPPEIPLVVKKVPANPEVAKMMMTPAMPAAFDTKNVGRSLEMEINAKETPEVIEVQLKFDRTSFLDRLTWGQGLAETEMAEFSVQQIEKLVLLKDGAPTLVGTMSPPKGKLEEGAKRRVWMAFATATAVKLEK